MPDPKPTAALAVPAPESLDTIRGIGEVLARSGFFADARDASKAIAKILAGRELGFGPMASMMSVHIIQGRPAISPSLMAAALKRSGRYDYRIKRLDAQGCALLFLERERDSGQWVELGLSEFTKEDAFKAGLGQRTGYRSYPRNMYFARAMGNGVRWYCPDLFGGPVYVPEELGATVDDAGAAVALPPAAGAKGPVAPFESVKGVANALNRQYGHTAVKWGTATQAVFGQRLLTRDDLELFAQQQPDAWVRGCEILLDEGGDPE